MPRMKEPHFFAIDRVCLDSDLVITDETDYVRLFHKASGFKWCGEASPSYLWHVEVPSRIRDKVPDARIIILLRDPIERAYSQYLMDRGDGYTEDSFYAAVQEQLAHPDRVCYGTGSGYVS